MKKVFTIVMSLVLVLSLGSAVALADEPTTQSGEGIGVSAAGAMPLDGTWIIIAEYMNEGDFFTGSWTWDEPYLVRFTITDLFVVTDEFEVYDNGVKVLTTPSLPDYAALGIGAFDSPPWTDDPDVALAEPKFSKGVLYLGPGSHEITIRDIDIPTGFPDGTVAFKAEPLVEFTKEITDTTEGGDMDGRLEPGEDWQWTFSVSMKNLTDETLTVTKLHDRLGGDLEWHVIAWYSGLIGDEDVYTRGKTEKVFINFYDGFTLAPGQEEWLFSVSVSPDINTGKGTANNSDKNSNKNPKAGHQEYTSLGEHCLNSGAWFEGWIGDEYIEASTEPVCVEVLEAD